jgi:hypothetical protein
MGWTRGFLVSAELAPIKDSRPPLSPLVGFESLKLLEIDTEEKIGELADKLVAFCQQ